MEIIVKVNSVLTPMSYNKKDGTQGVRYAFVGTTTNGRFDKTIKFNVETQEKWKELHIMVGSTYNVYFDLESNEWKGKWFTTCKVWKVSMIDGNGQQK